MREFHSCAVTTELNKVQKEKIQVRHNYRQAKRKFKCNYQACTRTEDTKENSCEMTTTGMVFFRKCFWEIIFKVVDMGFCPQVDRKDHAWFIFIKWLVLYVHT